MKAKMDQDCGGKGLDLGWREVLVAIASSCLHKGPLDRIGVRIRVSNKGNSMVKSELIESLAERADITLAKAEEVVDLFFNSVTETLAGGDRVEIRGFGAFTVRDYKSYKGRNPKTGEQIVVPPKRLPFWKTGQELKQRVDSAFIDKQKRGEA